MMQYNVIVTGASSGIGYACATKMLSLGHRVVVMDIAVEQLRENFSHMDSAYPVFVDVSSVNSCRDAVACASSHLERIDALVHFAGVWTGTPWDRTDHDEWDKILSINLVGSFSLAQACAAQMVTTGGGSIVLTASGAARVGGVAAGPAYAASKGGVISLTRSLARALGPHQIRVNAVNPGMVESRMSASFSPDLVAQTIARTPLGRIAQPEDIADVACFLALQDSRFITGEIIEVNGGFYFD